jgi:predicted O-methyltransferase YrrM
MGFLSKEETQYQVPLHVAVVLSEVSPDNVLPAIRHHANCLRRWAELAHVVKTGKPADRTPSIAGPQADLAAFIGAMDNFARITAPQVIEKLRPLKFRHLLDIGGGPGTWTIAFLQAVPDATATLFDLPEVIPLAKKRLAQAELTERVMLVAGDYNIDDLPAAADFAWLSAVAHQNSREQNRALFTKIYHALLPDGTLIIRDVVMNASRTSPQAGALFAINMLVSTNAGGTYTFDEFGDDLSCAGFTDVELLHHDLAMHSLILARKSA